MTFRSFLRDRRRYVLLYVFVAVIMAVVYQFDLWLMGSSSRPGTVVYALMFSFVGLIAYIGFDYRRQAAFFRQLNMPFDGSSFAELATLPPPITLEQQVFSEAWHRLYAVLEGELVAERERGRRRVQLISQWAHHMKTPISVIDLEIQQARQHDANAKMVDLINSVDEENTRLSESLQTLLNVVRLDDFTTDFRVEAVDLRAIVRQVINEHRRAFIAHRVYPTFDDSVNGGEHDVQCIVKSDGKWLRLVLDQVFNNAIKYAARAEGKGHVRVKIVERERETVLEVADDGIGIAPEDLGRVFTPFFTGGTGRRYTRSTGMGLYFAHETCQRLGHRLTLQSKVGEGTVVHIHFTKDGSIFAAVGEPSTDEGRR